MQTFLENMRAVEKIDKRMHILLPTWKITGSKI